MRLLLVPLAVLCSCAPAVQINHAVVVSPPECAAQPKAEPLAEGLLDIGIDAASAGTYTAAFSVGADAKDITYDAIEVFYTTDQDRENELQLGHVPGTPINTITARHTTIGATSAGDVVVAPIVTPGDAALLQGEPFVVGGISVAQKVRIIANVRVVGKTAGGADVASQVFPFPLRLCEGCLLTPPQCGVDVGDPANPNDDTPIEPVANAGACFVGDDVPALACPG